MSLKTSLRRGYVVLFGFAVVAFAVLASSASAVPLNAKFPKSSSVVPVLDHGPTMTRIESSGEIVLGIRDDSPPFAVMKDGVPSGFSVEICRQVVSGLEGVAGHPIHITYVPVNSKTRFSLVQAGKIDMECGSTVDSVNREKLASFSLPFFVTGIQVAAKKGTPLDFDFRGAADGKTFAVVTNATSDPFTAQANRLAMGKGKGFTVKHFANNKEGLAAVVNGAAFGFLSDDILLAGAIMTNGHTESIIRVGPLLSSEPVAIMMKKDDPAFVVIVDKQVRRLLLDGVAEQLAIKWMSTPEMRYKLNAPTRENFRFPIKYPAQD